MVGGRRKAKDLISATQPITLGHDRERRKNFKIDTPILWETIRTKTTLNLIKKLLRNIPMCSIIWFSLKIALTWYHIKKPLSIELYMRSQTLTTETLRVKLKCKSFCHYPAGNKVVEVIGL